jgi:hypothetical protein
MALHRHIRREHSLGTGFGIRPSHLRRRIPDLSRMPPEMTISASAARAVLASISSIPRDEDGPVFEAPRQAQAFAMALTLQQRGIFTCTESAEMLGAARARTGPEDPLDMSGSYYIYLCRSFTLVHGLRCMCDNGCSGTVISAGYCYSQKSMAE